MNRSAISTKIGLAALLLILLAGCTTPYERRSDGVYAERTTRSTTAVVYVDPLIYPYWHQSFTATDRLAEADLALHRPYLES